MSKLAKSSKLIELLSNLENVRMKQRTKLLARGRTRTSRRSSIFSGGDSRIIQLTYCTMWHGQIDALQQLKTLLVAISQVPENVITVMKLPKARCTCVVYYVISSRVTIMMNTIVVSTQGRQAGENNITRSTRKRRNDTVRDVDYCNIIADRVLVFNDR